MVKGMENVETNPRMMAEVDRLFNAYAERQIDRRSLMKGILATGGAAALAMSMPRIVMGQTPDASPVAELYELVCRAAPFAAYRTVSILPSTYLGIEHATTVILDHLDVDPAVLEQTMERAGQEGLVIPRRLTDRLRHVFTEAA